jgi:hypothetical protein
MGDTERGAMNALPYFLNFLAASFKVWRLWPENGAWIDD